MRIFPGGPSGAAHAKAHGRWSRYHPFLCGGPAVLGRLIMMESMMSYRKGLQKWIPGVLAALPMLASANGYLENPQPNAIESGLGVISGWHCTASTVEVFIDGTSIGETGVGSLREDAVSVCGHNRSGYALLYNFNLAVPGEHEIKVFADGSLLETRKFRTLRSGGQPFLAGKSARTTVDNFPARGQSTVLEWSQAKQSFVVAGTADTASINGSYTLRRVSVQTERFGLLDTEDLNGIKASGTMTIAGSSYRQNISIQLDASSTPSAVTVNGDVVDMGFYLYDRISGNQLVVVERGAAVVTSYMYQEPTLGWSNEIQYWVKNN
jgi:hypothetical protein